MPQPNTNKYIIYGQTFHPAASEVTLDSMDVLGNLKVNWTEWQFDKPGTYTYICKEHPWAYGQIIVE